MNPRQWPGISPENWCILSDAPRYREGVSCFQWAYWVGRQTPQGRYPAANRGLLASEEHSMGGVPTAVDGSKRGGQSSRP